MLFTAINSWPNNYVYMGFSKPFSWLIALDNAETADDYVEVPSLLQKIAKSAATT